MKREGLCGIAQAKRHSIRFKQSKGRSYSCFWDIGGLHRYLVICSGYLTFPSRHGRWVDVVVVVVVWVVVVEEEEEKRVRSSCKGWWGRHGNIPPLTPHAVDCHARNQNTRVSKDACVLHNGVKLLLPIVLPL